MEYIAFMVVGRCAPRRMGRGSAGRRASRTLRQQAHGVLVRGGGSERGGTAGGLGSGAPAAGRASGGRGVGGAPPPRNRARGMNYAGRGRVARGLLRRRWWPPPPTGEGAQGAGAAGRVRPRAAVHGVAPRGCSARRGGGLPRLPGRLLQEVQRADGDGCGQHHGGGGAAQRGAARGAAGAAGRRRAELPAGPAVAPGRCWGRGAAVPRCRLRPGGLPGQHAQGQRRGRAPDVLPPQMLPVLEAGAGLHRDPGVPCSRSVPGSRDCERGGGRARRRGRPQRKFWASRRTRRCAPRAAAAGLRSSAAQRGSTPGAAPSGARSPTCCASICSWASP